MYFTAGFIKGFAEQNAAVAKITSQELIVNKYQSTDQLTDLDVLVEITQDCDLGRLFPCAATLAGNHFFEIGDVIIFELTSMTGEMTMESINGNPSKAESKLKTFEDLFSNDRQFLEVIGQSRQRTTVVFVYNGKDPAEVAEKFASDKFRTVTVHLPLPQCISWEKDVKVQSLLN
jgi:hypothetical protein